MPSAPDTPPRAPRTARRLLGRLIPVALVVAAAVGAGLIAWLPARVAPDPANEPVPVNVEVLRVEAVPRLADTITLSAVVEPLCVVRVAAEVAGRIEAFGRRQRTATWRGRTFVAGEPLDEGQPVEAGDVLVHLNRELLQARYDQARAQAEHDRTEYERVLDLYERRVTSTTELDYARTRFEVSRALLDEAARNLARADIAAPLSGILNRFTMEVGEYAAPGDVVAEIVAVDRVKVAVDVPERDVHHLKVGDRAEILLRAPQETVRSGEITYISELADPGTRTTRVEITVDNADQSLRSGQIVNARLTRQVLSDVIMIPLASVIPLEDGKEVYVVNDSHAQRRRVELGFIRGGSVQVLSGLRPGELLIVAGHRYVGHGQPVTVVQAAEPSAPALHASRSSDAEASP